MMLSVPSGLGTKYFSQPHSILSSWHVMLWHRLCNSILCVGEFQFSNMIWAPNLNIKHVSRFVLKNAETVEGTSILGPVVLAPDVEHEDTGNEEKGHYQNWNWANLDARTVISVESPHSTTASATSSYPM